MAMPDPDLRRPASKPRAKQPDLKELEEKYKETMKQRKREEQEKKEREKALQREHKLHDQLLSKQRKSAEKDEKKRQQELEKLHRSLDKVEKDRQNKEERSKVAIEKIDTELEKLTKKQHDIQEELEAKVKAAAIAKGHLSHVEIANNLFNQCQVSVKIEVIEGLEEELERERQAKEHEANLNAQVDELRTLNQERAAANDVLRSEIAEARRELQELQEEIAFMCCGAELSGVTYLNLQTDTGIGHLGPGFAFFATIRMDRLCRGAKVFDFGNGQQLDNIWAGLLEDSNNLSFAVFQGGAPNTLIAEDFWVVGETHDYLFSVTHDGEMRAYKDGALCAYKEGVPLQRMPRMQMYVGRSSSEADELFQGGITDIRVWSHGVDWSVTGKSIGPACPELNSTEAYMLSLAASPPKSTALTMSYPCGVDVRLHEFLLSGLALENQVLRLRMLQEIDSGNHLRIAMRIFRTLDPEMRGYLSLDSGKILEFVNSVFKHYGAKWAPEDHVRKVVARFDLDGSGLLAMRECVCLADVLLRALFFVEVKRGGPVSATSLIVEPLARGPVTVGGRPMVMPSVQRASPLVSRVEPVAHGVTGLLGRMAPEPIAAPRYGPEQRGLSELATRPARFASRYA